MRNIDIIGALIVFALIVLAFLPAFVQAFMPKLPKRLKRVCKVLQLAVCGPAVFMFMVGGGEEGKGGSGGEFTKAMEPIVKEFKETTGKLSEALTRQEAEIKQYGETSAETAKQIKAIEDKLTALNDDLKAAQARGDELEKKFGRPGYSGGGEVKSIGQQFVESEAYKNMLARKSYTSEPMEVKGLTSASGSAGDLVIPQRHPEIIAPPDRVLRIRDLMTVLTTESNAIEYVEETGFTNNAAFVAEGAAKPESNLTFELKTESVKNIGHWIPASRQILNDVSQLRGYIDNRLLYGIKLAEEAQLLYGTGVGQNLQGIMTHPNVQTYKMSDGPLKTDTKLDAIRRAMTLSILAGYPVSGVVIHPKDWEEIELLKGTDGKYIWVQVVVGGVKQVWAAPIVDTPAINQGESCVGAFQMGSFLYDREQSQVRVAEQHEDFFIKGMVAILAEERLAQTIMRPESFVAVTLDHSPVADKVPGSGSGYGSGSGS